MPVIVVVRPRGGRRRPRRPGTPRRRSDRRTPVVGVLGRLRADHVLHGEARVAGGEVVADRYRLQVLQDGRPAVPVHVGGGLHHVVAGQRRDRDRGDLRDAERGGVRGELLGYRGEHGLRVVDQVHLVDGQHHVRDAEQGGDGGVPAGLLDDPVAGVDQDHGQLGGGGAGHHVPRVLHVARGVGEDEPAAGGGEVAVGHVDGDALLALGAQPVGQQRQVRRLLAAVQRRLLDGLQLVGEDRFGVVQQTAHEGGLAVVDGPGGGEAQQGGGAQLLSGGGHGGLSCGSGRIRERGPVPCSAGRRRESWRCHGEGRQRGEVRYRGTRARPGPTGGPQKYPSRLRSSIAASDILSSARVAPRSVSREAAISVITASSVVASESTAPVQDMSPTVR